MASLKDIFHSRGRVAPPYPVMEEQVGIAQVRGKCVPFQQNMRHFFRVVTDALIVTALNPYRMTSTRPDLHPPAELSSAKVSDFIVTLARCRSIQVLCTRIWSPIIAVPVNTVSDGRRSVIQIN